MSAAAPLDGRVALVTGGSRGIGGAISEALADAGATVAVNYRSDSASAEDIVARLGSDSSTWQADVADPEASAKMVEGVIERHGRLDLLIANAGVWRGGPIESVAPEDWELVIQTSLGGAFNLARASLPTMRANGFGRIVVVSSVIGMIGFPGDSAYASAKAGLFGFVKALAKECGEDGITVNAIAPGFVETDMTSAVSRGARELMLRRTILRRPGKPSEIAAAARFLTCDADYVTGQTLVVDGGMTL